VKQKSIKKLINKWVYRLGLRWWTVTINYYDDAREIIRIFGNDSERTVIARTYSDWRYATCVIEINLPELLDMTKEESERVIVHELCHALVNEMREDGIDHEERVVTGLTKAFLWTQSDCLEGDNSG
jgi:hypothetical protein